MEGGRGRERERERQRLQPEVNSQPHTKTRKASSRFLGSYLYVHARPLQNHYSFQGIENSPIIALPGQMIPSLMCQPDLQRASANMCQFVVLIPTRPIPAGPMMDANSRITASLCLVYLSALSAPGLAP